MSRLNPPRRILELNPAPAIALTQSLGERAGRARWAGLLTWFCRLCAVFWLLAGLLNWAFFLGVVGPIDGDFATTGGARQWAIGFFAVVDLIAAVGLWLTAPWGSTVWLLAASAQIAFPFVLHDYGAQKTVTTAVTIALISVYFLLIFMYKREERTMLSQ